MSPRANRLALLLLALAGLTACWGGPALLWDGAYQLCQSLTAGKPFYHLSRFHSYLVWLPTTWLAAHSAGVAVLKWAYAAPFCFAPLAGAALSWWIVGKRAPHLMVWALFGIAAAMLPGQVFMINDSIFQMHLFWPVFFACLLPLSPAQTVVIALVSIFQLSHPLGIGLCALASAAAALQARRDARPSGYLWSGWLALLAVAGIGKLLLWPDPYAASEATFAQLVGTFEGGVLGWPLNGLVFAWAAAALLFWKGVRRSSGPAALVLVALAGACWLFWAADPARWTGAISYRRWVAPFSLPFLLAAAFELWRGVPLAPALLVERSRAGLAVAAIFLLVLGVQSLETHALFERLDREVAAVPGPWLPESRLSWVRGTPLDHWGLHCQVLLAQGRTPRLLLWNGDAASAASTSPPSVALSPVDFKIPAEFPRGWFQWGSLPGLPPDRSPQVARAAPVSGFAPN